MARGPCGKKIFPSCATTTLDAAGGSWSESEFQEADQLQTGCKRDTGTKQSCILSDHVLPRTIPSQPDKRSLVEVPTPRATGVDKAPILAEFELVRLPVRSGAFAPVLPTWRWRGFPGQDLVLKLLSLPSWIWKCPRASL
eukprot:352159-Chlamydomonas_euryale.AAC.15